MKTAVLIQAHKEPLLLNRLVRTFDHPDFAVYVNLDSKSEIDPAAIDARARLVSRRRDIRWGGFDLVASTLDSLAEIESAGDYGYLIYVSGQDYPVWGAERIRRFLAEANGRQFVHHAPLAPGGWPEAAERVEYAHYTGTSPVRRLASKALRGVNRALGLKRAMPAGLSAYGGSNWMTLSREAVAAILAYVAANPGYVEFMQTVSIPDELFFHTILMNSPLRETVVNDNLRYIDWSERLPNPKVLTRADHAAIAASGKMFCRKVDSRSSLELLDLLDAGRRDA